MGRLFVEYTRHQPPPPPLKKILNNSQFKQHIKFKIFRSLYFMFQAVLFIVLGSAANDCSDVYSMQKISVNDPRVDRTPSTSDFKRRAAIMNISAIYASPLSIFTSCIVIRDKINVLLIYILCTVFSDSFQLVFLS